MTKDNDLDEAPRKAAGTALRYRRSIDAAIGQVDHLTLSIKAQEMNTSISEMIENTRAVALSPSIQQAIDSIKALQIDPVVTDLANSINMHQEAMRLAIEPFASIKQPLVFEELELIKTQFSEMTHIAKQFQERFRMPELGEAAKLAAEIQGQMQVQFEPLRLQSEAISKAMKAIRSPWLDTSDALRSAQSFTALQGIGKTLAQFPVFGDEVTFSFRNHLGDWREPFELSQNIINDIAARSALC